MNFWSGNFIEYINSHVDIDEKIKSIFDFQLKNNSVLHAFHTKTPSFLIDELPVSFSFLPISFFKFHSISSYQGSPATTFLSSGTTLSVRSKHMLYRPEIYKNSVVKCIENILDISLKDYAIKALLPNYLEQGYSSLVYMADHWISQGNKANSGFYKFNFDELNKDLEINETHQIPTILIGVSYALLDYGEQFPSNLKFTKIIETGGMKGRKQEMSKELLLNLLSEKFGTTEIYSEYGMTELFSQAYKKINGQFKLPNSMKIFVADPTDPFSLKTKGKGTLNIIDLMNLDTCSFIATEDLGEIFEDGSFNIIGRLNARDIRGCSQLYFE